MSEPSFTITRYGPTMSSNDGIHWERTEACNEQHPDTRQACAFDKDHEGDHSWAPGVQPASSGC